MQHTQETGPVRRRIFHAAALSTPALLAVLLATLAPRGLCAATPAEPWDGPAFSARPAAIARAAADVQTGEEGVLVLLTEARYTYDQTGRETYTQHMVYKIGDASAHESWSAVEQAWSPWNEEVPRIRARVITPDGAEHVLDQATLTENGEAAESSDMFEDGRILRGPLPAIVPGAVVEQEVVVRETKPFYAPGVTHYPILGAAVPVRLARLVLEVPAAAPLRWVARRLPDLATHDEVTDGRRRLRFEARDLPPVEDVEPGLPPEAPRTPYIAFSTGASWTELAKSYSEIVDRTLAGADLQPFLKAARVPAASQVETIERLLARVHQEVRYTGLELGAGGLIPRTPAETLRRKFGDCKDKAVLLTGLLRAMDIPAYVALLYATEDDQDVEEALPGFGIFNHAIVVVPGRPSIWIDATDPYARLGSLPDGDQGRLALIAAPSTSGLVRTPVALSADNREIETRQIHLAELGKARVIETTEYLGGAEGGIRAYYATTGTDQIREELASYVKGEYLADELTGMELSDPKDLSKPFRLHLEASGAARGVTEIADAAVAFSVMDLINRLPDELVPDDEDAGMEPRENDYVFLQPFQVEVRYRVVPPDGFRPHELPASRERKLGPALLTETYGADAAGVISATLRLDVGKRRISAQEFDALRTAAGEIAEEESILLAFEQVGEAHLSAGRVHEALTEFERLAAAQPKSALPRLRVARALLAGGLGEAARQEAERAIRLQPDQALPYRTLGWILQHDVLGRRFGPGFDRAASIAAYRKAKELDPSDAIARADLAILLEHDDRGERYGPGVDLSAAIDEYRALRKDLEVSDMDDNLTVALLRAERLPELRDLLGELEDTEQRKTLKVVTDAALDGPDAAIRQAARGAATPEARTTMLRNAAQNLLVLRRYPEAAALLDRASRQASDAAALLSLVDVLRKVKRHEDMQISLREPAGPIRRLLQLMASGDKEGGALASILSRRAVASMKAENVTPDEGMGAILAVLRRNFRSENLPLAAALEVGLASLTDQVTGDPAIGYRVKMVNTTAGASREITSFVIPDGDEYRLTVMHSGFEELGLDALDSLEKGDLRAARQWLDWAHEELVGSPSDDPLLNDPLAALWERGKEGTAEEIRCAASILALQADTTDGRLRAVLACREAATEPAHRQAFDQALFQAYQELHRPTEAAEVAARLATAEPTSKFGFLIHARTLQEIRRDDEARHLVEERLRTTPDDLDALHELVRLEERAGHLDRRDELLRGLVESGKAESTDYNNLAWSALLRGKVDDQAIAHAQRSANLRGYSTYPPLHTLASLYAEVGKTAEAYQIILQALGTKPDETPEPDDWYVFGRLAEHYGRLDIARVYYERVQTNPDETEALSTYALARKRLAALPKAPKAGRAG